MNTTKAFVVDGKDRADVTADAIAVVHDTMIMSTDPGLSAKGRMMSGAITMMGNVIIAAANSEQTAKSMMTVFAQEVGKAMGDSMPELLKAIRKKIGADQAASP